MAARVINVLQAYLRSLRSATEAPLTCSTIEQARTIYESLSEIDRLQAGLRQKVQNIQRAKERKAELLLEMTPSCSIIKANLLHIYGGAASQNANSLRDADYMVVLRWIRTIPTKAWGYGMLSADVRSLVMMRMAETQEAPALTPDEFEVMAKMAEGELRESQEYLNFYAAILEACAPQGTVIVPNLCMSIQAVLNATAPSEELNTQSSTGSKQRRLHDAQDTGYHGHRREDDTRYGNGENSGHHGTRGEDRFAMRAQKSPSGRTGGLLHDQERGIEFVYTNAPVENISFLGEPIASAVEDSTQRKSEKDIRAANTDCISVLAPKDVTKDWSLVICISRELGLELVDLAELQRKPPLKPA